MLSGLDLEISMIRAEADQGIGLCQTLPRLEQCRIDYLGKQGRLTRLLKQLGSVPEAERRQRGQELNELKDHLNALLQKQKQSLEDQLLSNQTPAIDLTLPGRGMDRGHLHPITRTLAFIEAWFGGRVLALSKAPK